MRLTRAHLPCFIPIEFAALEHPGISAAALGLYAWFVRARHRGPIDRARERFGLDAAQLAALVAELRAAGLVEERAP
ncbi:hypothetical protein [Methylobacterium sp. JK268]